MDCLEFLQQVLDPAPQPTLISSLDGVVSWSNRAARSAIGDLAGQRLADVTANDGGVVGRTLSLARGTSRRLHVGLKIRDYSGVLHVWRVDVYPTDIDPFLILEADAEHELITRLITLKIEAEGAAVDRDREADAARKLRREASRLLRLAQTDRLTGLMNRTGFEAHTRRVLSGGTNPGMFVFADLDGFKRLNDEHGHDAGDAVLREIAKRFSTELRSRDCVARLGGDEFAFWFDGLTRKNMGRTIQRLEELTALPVRWKDVLDGEVVELRVGVSFGRAFAPNEGQTFEALKALSDKRMYKRKRRRQHMAQDLGAAGES